MGIEVSCDHRAKTDLTCGLGEVRNWYCKTCGTHWYKGKEWSKKEWEEWINSEEVEWT